MKLYFKHRKAINLILIAYSVLIGTWMTLYYSLPSPLFNSPVSVVIDDQNSKLLSARIAADQQWRFPQNPSVPNKFKQAILTYEDKRFFSHIGFDPFALVRATYTNLKNGRVVSGASTLSMQVIRMVRKQNNRTVFEKLIEIILSVRLELEYSKEEILSLYTSNAPFGGNVVGLDAAAWRYFGRDATQLSWSEIASMAVLPNQPSLVHLKRNRPLLKQKRDRLLNKLWEANVIDSITNQLAQSEELVPEPKAIPNFAPHLLDHIKKNYSNKTTKRVTTSIDKTLQIQSANVTDVHHQLLRINGIHNIAALIIDNESNEVKAYIGNSKAMRNSNTHGQSVDVIQSRRSTGSILKPFLYAGMIEDGLLMPEALIADIPTRFGGFQPVNFNKTYSGAIPANLALSRSLNIPAVRLLKEYGIGRFYSLLKEMRMSTLDFSASHYGLSLILGGSEAKLWDIANMYTTLVRLKRNHPIENAHIFKEVRKQEGDTQQQQMFSKSVLYHIFNALTEVKRPASQGQWKQFSSAKKIAWKTGTSYGFRDAWAVGVTPKYTVAVWAGNADGEGRPNIIGVVSAAPIMFDLFDLLEDNQQWFSQPIADMIPMNICLESGYRASDICVNTESQLISKQVRNTKICPYHKRINLDPTLQYQVNSDCLSPSESISKAWFVLPPQMEWFYKSSQSTYRELPKFMATCNDVTTNQMEMIYPVKQSKIYIPIELDGQKGNAVFEVAHRRPATQIFWHLNEKFIGSTKDFHQLAVNASNGEHLLTLVDEMGNRLETTFLVESD